MAYIRRQYDVPARRGGRIRIWTGEEGTIISADRGNLKVRFDDGFVGLCHAAFGVEYLGTGVAV